VEFNRLAMEKAVSWIQANPARFAALTFRRAIYFWCDMRAHGDKFFIRGAISLLGLAGLWLMWRRGLTLQAVLLGIVWIAYPTTFYMIQYMERYVAPIGPAILLPAGFAAWALAVPKAKLVEAGGVELPVSVENTQLADSAISLIAPLALFACSVSRFVTISSFPVRTLESSPRAVK